MDGLELFVRIIYDPSLIPIVGIYVSNNPSSSMIVVLSHYMCGITSIQDSDSDHATAILHSALLVFIFFVKPKRQFFIITCPGLLIGRFFCCFLDLLSVLSSFIHLSLRRSLQVR